ncbi:MBOAT family protein [Paenibacillus sp. 19GGS1-52]|uniref:MBOAT family O-acyltransferase n=1 Tax=Paenibacillus sp. 19GGS1-52 TaxID=2758563 RepID=UPI001EFBBFA0|nr:MBOAT family O-acyltransferase [Paenibacillus sp. 19GGS1-52]ULO09256.1 MBOAT family protein [Paenibacillus sp. 19GGS1-52]
MLFNSYGFIFAFLPVVLIMYFLFIRLRYFFIAKLWLALSSLFFYGWWNVRYIPLILLSIAVNYIVGRRLVSSTTRRSVILFVGIGFNALLLGYYKYADFFIVNWNGLIGAHVPILHLLLPLGISFFTFTQIAYLVDAYRGRVQEYKLINYILFVTFFPHLIAGPILHHKDMMPQFERLRNKVWNWSNVLSGALLFCIGLAKKMLIADTLASYANSGFTSATQFIDSWVACLSYTFQIYYDFSGYTDMAIGVALLFNIRLPQNFNSPYRATSIQDFWRRWHITLSHFLRDYIYIPLGGSRRGFWTAIRNVLITFLIGGIWHGASWMFILWGLLHGGGQAVQHIWKRWGRPLPLGLCWLLTFGFINVTWVFFRAHNLQQAGRLLRGMLGINGLGLSTLAESILVLPVLAVLLLVMLTSPNLTERLSKLTPNWRTSLFMAVLFMISLLFFNRITEFLYFNF